MRKAPSASVVIRNDGRDPVDPSPAPRPRRSARRRAGRRRASRASRAPRPPAAKDRRRRRRLDARRKARSGTAGHVEGGHCDDFRIIRLPRDIALFRPGGASGGRNGRASLKARGPSRHWTASLQTSSRDDAMLLAHRPPPRNAPPSMNIVRRLAPPRKNQHDHRVPRNFRSRRSHRARGRAPSAARRAQSAPAAASVRRRRSYRRRHSAGNRAAGRCQ